MWLVGKDAAAAGAEVATETTGAAAREARPAATSARRNLPAPRATVPVSIRRAILAIMLLLFPWLSMAPRAANSSMTSDVVRHAPCWRYSMALSEAAWRDSEDPMTQSLTTRMW